MAQDPDVGLVHDPESSTPPSDAKLKLSWANLSIAQHLSSYPRIRIHATVTYPRTRQGAAGCLMVCRFGSFFFFFFFHLFYCLFCSLVSSIGILIDVAIPNRYIERYSVKSRKPCPISSSPMVNATVNVTKFTMCPLTHPSKPTPATQPNWIAPSKVPVTIVYFCPPRNCGVCR